MRPRTQQEVSMNRKIILAALPAALCIAFLIGAPGWAREQKVTETAGGPEYYAMPSTGGAPLPFSESVKVGDTLFISGQIGNLPGTLTLAPGGLGAGSRAATRQNQALLG